MSRDRDLAAKADRDPAQIPISLFSWGPPDPKRYAQYRELAYLRRPLKTSPVLQQALAEIRKTVAFLETDRPFAPDIEAVFRLVGEGRFLRLLWPSEETAPILAKETRR